MSDQKRKCACYHPYVYSIVFVIIYVYVLSVNLLIENKQKLYCKTCLSLFTQRAGKPKTKAKRSLPSSGSIDHATARTLIPPDCALWQSRCPGSWNIKVAPLRNAVCRSWNKYGQVQALFLVVVEAWKLWCTVHGARCCIFFKVDHARTTRI